MKFRTLFVAVALTTTLTACGGSDDKGSDLPSSSPTPSPTKSTTGTLLDSVPAAPPERPKDVRSQAGAFSFSGYSLDMIFYAIATSDVDALYAIADRNLCRACKQVQDGIEKRDGRVQVGRSSPEASDPKLTSHEGEFYTVRQRVKIPKGAVIDPKTGKEYSQLKSLTQVMNVNVRWVKDAWVLLDYKFTEDKTV